MESFSAEVGSRGYHVYRNDNWTNIAVHQQVTVLKETDPVSKGYDPYCCKITVVRIDRIGPVTVGHIPRELSRFVHYFLHEGGSITGIVVSTQHRVSPIPEGGLEIPIQMTFSHRSKHITNKMKTLVDTQVAKMAETFRMDDERDDDDDDEVEDIVMHDDGENETMAVTETTTSLPEEARTDVIVIDDSDDDDDVNDDGVENSPTTEIQEEEREEEKEEEESEEAIDFDRILEAQVDEEELFVEIVEQFFDFYFFEKDLS